MIYVRCCLISSFYLVLNNTVQGKQLWYIAQTLLCSNKNFIVTISTIVYKINQMNCMFFGVQYYIILLIL